jgi:hypothetical protein
MKDSTQGWRHSGQSNKSYGHVVVIAERSPTSTASSIKYKECTSEEDTVEQIFIEELLPFLESASLPL